MTTLLVMICDPFGGLVQVVPFNDDKQDKFTSIGARFGFHCTSPFVLITSGDKYTDVNNRVGLLTAYLAVDGFLTIATSVEQTVNSTPTHK